MMMFGSEALHTPYRAGPRFSRGAGSSLGMHATEMAWTECDDWLTQLLRYLEDNRNRIGATARRRELRIVSPEFGVLNYGDSLLNLQA